MNDVKEKSFERFSGISLSDSTYTKLLHFMSRFKNVKLLVVGDLGLDEYLKGPVHRVSPEAPVPVLEVNEQEFSLGLSSNVAQNILSLGGQVCLTGVLGEDEASRKLNHLLLNFGIKTDSLLIDKNRMTTRKVRIISGPQHMLRVDYENKQALSLEMEEKFLRVIQSLIPKCDGVIIEDYAKGILNERVIQKIIEFSHMKKKKVIVDPHRETPLHHYWGADVFKPNKDEAFILSNLYPSNEKLREKNREEEGKTKEEKEQREKERKNLFFEKVGRKLLDQLACERIVITRGEEGMTLLSSQSAIHIPTEPQPVFDVTGAGDTALATMSLGWFAGLSLEEACFLSNLSAGLVVGKIGAESCSEEELKMALKRAHQRSMEEKNIRDSEDSGGMKDTRETKEINRISKKTSLFSSSQNKRDRRDKENKKKEEKRRKFIELPLDISLNQASKNLKEKSK